MKKAQKKPWQCLFLEIKLDIFIYYIVQQMNSQCKQLNPKT